jgi:hypothetical protein
MDSGISSFNDSSLVEFKGFIIFVSSRKRPSNSLYTNQNALWGTFCEFLKAPQMCARTTLLWSVIWLFRGPRTVLSIAELTIFILYTIQFLGWCTPILYEYIFIQRNTYAWHHIPILGQQIVYSRKGPGPISSSTLSFNCAALGIYLKYLSLWLVNLFCESRRNDWRSMVPTPTRDIIGQN